MNTGLWEPFRSVGTNYRDAIFINNTSVERFPEFSLFGVSVLVNDSFAGCSKLKDIDLSKIKTMGISNFKDCLALNIDLNLPLLESVGPRNFYNTGIVSITNLGSIVEIPDYFCYNCKNLASITLPMTVETIGEYAFFGCSALEQVNVHWSRIKTIKNSPFPPLDIEIVNLTGLTQGADRIVAGFRTQGLYVGALTSAYKGGYYSENIYNSGTFAGVYLGRYLKISLLYLKDIQTLYPGSFANSNIENLVINNVQPPAWHNSNDVSDDSVTNDANKKDRVFSGCSVGGIYVPDNALQIYVEDSNWSSMANKLKPLSQLPRVSTRVLWDTLPDNDKQNTLIEEYM